MRPLRLLFLCSRNQWRSPTAEAVYRDDPRVEVSSAGVSSAARRRVSEKGVNRADLIVVMEHEHRQRLREAFPQLDVPVEVLDIPDDFGFMDAELVALIRERVEPLITRGLAEGGETI